MAAGWAVTSSPVSIVANTPKTVIELATPSTVSNYWFQLDMSFDGVLSTSVPARVEIITYTTTGTGTAITFAAAHRMSPSLQAMALNPATTAKVNMSAEGTGSITVVTGIYIHPQAGIVFQYPLGREMGMKPSMFYGFRITTPAAAATINCLCNAYFEET